MEDNEIKVGNTVKHVLSSSPAMYVKEINNERYQCVWFSENKELCEASFSISEIKKFAPTRAQGISVSN
jgi:uncharacterized protein YodC (DUF2158 family)